MRVLIARAKNWHTHSHFNALTIETRKKKTILVICRNVWFTTLTLSLGRYICINRTVYEQLLSLSNVHIYGSWYCRMWTDTFTIEIGTERQWDRAREIEQLDFQQKWVIEMTMDVKRTYVLRMYVCMYVCGWYSHSWNLFRKTTVRESDKWMIYCITKASSLTLTLTRDMETISHRNHMVFWIQWPMRKSSIKRLQYAYDLNQQFCW